MIAPEKIRHKRGEKQDLIVVEINGLRLTVNGARQPYAAHTVKVISYSKK
jgi:hypothetical protein